MPEKLPKGIVFPVSKSVLKERLSSAPQFADIKIDLYYLKPMSEARRRKTKWGMSRKNLPAINTVKVLDATYKLSAVGLITPNVWLTEGFCKNTFTKEKWTVSAYAVSEKILEKVREALLTEGLDRLLAWFVKTNIHAGIIGTHTLTISFDGTRLVYREYDAR